MDRTGFGGPLVAAFSSESAKSTRGRQRLSGAAPSIAREYASAAAAGGPALLDDFLDACLDEWESDDPRLEAVANEAFPHATRMGCGRASAMAEFVSDPIAREVASAIMSPPEADIGLGEAVRQLAARPLAVRGRLVAQHWARHRVFVPSSCDEVLDVPDWAVRLLRDVRPGNDAYAESVRTRVLRGPASPVRGMPLLELARDVLPELFAQLVRDDLDAFDAGVTDVARIAATLYLQMNPAWYTL